MTPDPRFAQRFEELRQRLLQVAADHADAMTYYKRRWDEDRGDEHAVWGCSDWYFEVAPDGTITRQMEVYDNGTVLQYNANHIEDSDGGLTDQELDHSEARPFAIIRDEFEAAWNSHPPTNRR